MSEPLLLSYRAAARLLGVGRGDSLHALIRSGLLKPVTLLGRSLIPREQIEALARHGDQVPVVAPPKAKRKGSIADFKL